MTDYLGRLTPIGVTKQSAFITGGTPISIAQIAFGDGDGSAVTFSDSSTGLVNEVYRTTISRAYVSGGKAIVEAIVPPGEGGWWLREIAAIDSTGAVVAVANTPDTYKPDPTSGASRLLIVSMSFSVANASVINEVILDSTAVLATRAYADTKAAAAQNSAVSHADSAASNAQSAAIAHSDNALSVAISALPVTWGDAAKLGGQTPDYYATDLELTALQQAVALLMPTGTELGYWGSTAPAGFVMASGRTIGSAASGATERANDDTLALYTLLWNSVAQTELPIQTSAGGASTRGANAAADFAANKRLPLPDARGRAGVGKDDMGGTLAGRTTITLTGTKASTSSGVITGLSSTANLSTGMLAFGTGIPAGATILTIDSSTQVTLSANSTSTGSISIRFGVIDGSTLGAAGGVQTHKLTLGQMPAHWHVENHTGSGAVGQMQGGGGSSSVVSSGIPTSSAGGDQAHGIIQPSIVRNVIIKL